MGKNEKVLLISALAALVICGGLYMVNARLSLGLFAGYMTGIVNFFLIASQVKKVVGGPGSTASKVTAGAFFYFLRLLGAAAVIAVVVKNVKYFSLAGFLTGFTLCLAVMIAVHAAGGKK